MYLQMNRSSNHQLAEPSSVSFEDLTNIKLPIARKQKTEQANGSSVICLKQNKANQTELILVASDENLDFYNTNYAN